MNYSWVRGVSWASALASLVSLPGCGMSRNDQLESVARDWCMTIRASQVIPVYPLTEDIQPGDVFLVQVPIDRQQSVYKQRGFLPLDNHLARLDPDGYADFYDHSFPITSAAKLPHDWMKAAGSNAAWYSAPNAAFPTYSFSVSKGGGLNLAVPISSVPVAMSLMGTHTANGTVSIKKTRTLGVDTMSLHTQLEQWVQEAPQRRAFLASFGPAPNRSPRNFVRVITRVYTTGQLDVQVNDARSVSGGVDAGVARPVNLFEAQAPTGPEDTRAAATSNYHRNLALINAGLAESTSGAPLSRSGDDAGLGPEELAAKVKKRAEERKKRADAETENLTSAQAAAEQPSKDAAEAKAVWDEKSQAVKQIKADILKVQGAVPPPSDQEAQLAALGEKLKAAQLEERQAKADFGTKAIPAAEAQASVEVARQALAQVSDFLPGGSVRVAAASARSVTMQETFDPPLTIGYLGFDVPILAGGALGRPIPTHAVIDRTFNVPLETDARIARELVDPSIINAMYLSLAKDQSSTARAIRDRLDNLKRFVRTDLKEVKVDRAAGTIEPIDAGFQRESFLDYARYNQVRDRSRRLLEELRDAHSYQVKDASGALAKASDADYRALDDLIDDYRTPQNEQTELERVREDLFAYYQHSGVGR